MDLAFPVMSKVCAEPANKENGAARYHSAYLASLAYGNQVPDAVLNVLEEWLSDTSGKIYDTKKVKVGASGSEKEGKDELKLSLSGDSRVMAVQALRVIGVDRVAPRKNIVQQLRALAADKETHEELRKETKVLLK